MADEPTPTETTPEPASTLDPTPAEPQVTDPTPQPEAEAGSGPDIGDAISQLNAAREAFESQVQPADDGLGSLYGLGDLGIEEQPQAQPQAQPEQPPEENNLAQLEEWVDQRAEARVRDYAIQQELSRRAAGVQQLVEEHPEIREHFEAIDNRMRMIDPRYGEQGYVPDPEAVRTAWLATQAELASQETGEPTPPEQPGMTVETGAGPGAAPEPEDPVAAAYAQALGGNGVALDEFGFPKTQP